MRSSLWYCLVLCALILGACSKDDQREIDEALIQDFIAEHNLVTQTTASGLHYIIDVPGSNEHPTINDDVRFSYIGFLLNGNIFDLGDDINYPLSGLIEGFQEGLPLFGKGGTGRLIIPSHLGYGEAPQGGIPSNSVLVFDVSLIDFQ
ncbi:MAG: FKBP-type peptidyl-prolyl cis-trans isomerase [Bacteroidota bacterium]|nr:FKBP-type peptidyl-prolyl cis-trans isomerase [Bacteroidota bacterium]